MSENGLLERVVCCSNKQFCGNRSVGWEKSCSNEHNGGSNEQHNLEHFGLFFLFFWHFKSWKLINVNSLY